MQAIRILTYWLTSVVAAGTVAGLAHFSTYSSHRGKFWEAFALYTIPIPMALGMIHLPMLILGTIACKKFATPIRWKLLNFIAVCFVIAVLFHIVCMLMGNRDHWALFAFVTVDLGILLAIGFFMPVESRTQDRTQ